MKVLFLGSCASSHDMKWIERIADGHEVILLGGRGESNSRHPGDIRVYPILGPYSVLNVPRMIKQRAAIRSIAKDFRPDIVHSMYAVPNAIYGDIASRGNHVITTRGSDLLVDFCQTLRRPRTLAQRVAYPVLRGRLVSAIRRAAYVTSTSGKQHAIVATLRRSSTSTAVIRTGVDSIAFSGRPKEVADSDFRLFCPRTMMPLYNIDLLVEVVSHLARQGHGRLVRLLLIDDHPESAYSARVRGLVSALGVSDLVSIRPRLQPAELREAYNSADAIIMVPRSDGTPVSGIEAMMMCRPLILGALQYDSDLFCEDTVWRARSFSVADIADTIVRVMEDPEGRASRTLRAREEAMRLANLDASVEAITKIYKQVCANRNAG